MTQQNKDNSQTLLDGWAGLNNTDHMWYTHWRRCTLPVPGCACLNTTYALFAGPDSWCVAGTEHDSLCIWGNRVGEDIHHGGDPHRPWDHGAEHE